MFPEIEGLVCEKLNPETVVIRFGEAAIALCKSGEILIGNGESMIALNEHVTISAKQDIYLN